MQTRTRQLSGLVIRTRIAPGSKSDHVGVALRTDNGDQNVLRRSGGNAFHDEVLEGAVGKKISGRGFVSGRDFILNE